MEKYYRDGQATDGKTAHAHCMLDNKGYKHTLRMCNTSCSSTAKMVAGTLLSVTLHVHYLFCLNAGRPMYQPFGKTRLEPDGLTFHINCLYSSFHIPKFDTVPTEHEFCMILKTSSEFCPIRD